MRKPTGEKVKAKSDRWVRDDVAIPAEQRRAINDRLAGLLHPNIMLSQTLPTLLFSAYKQGVEDAIEVYRSRGMLLDSDRRER